MKTTDRNSRSILSTLRSFGFAFNGIRLLISTQGNFRFHLFAAVTVCILGVYLEISQTQWVALILAICAVTVAEAFNTALEFLTDLVAPDYHELAGKAKDVAAGAVLIAAIMALAVGFIIFMPLLFPS